MFPKFEVAGAGDALLIVGEVLLPWLFDEINGMSIDD
jgi:hypothetical protein